MNNLLEKTGVSTKNKGDGLTASDINAINSKVNDEVIICNSYLKNFCNVNQELGDNKQRSILEAIKDIPTARRLPGLTIKFLGGNGKFVEMIYGGEDTEGWENTDNWYPVVNRIDGGEW